MIAIRRYIITLFGKLTWARGRMYDNMSIKFEMSVK